MMKLVKFWENYWFRPAPLIDLAVCRIIIVGYQLFYLIKMNYVYKMKTLSSLPDSLYDALPLLHLLVMPFGWSYRPPFEGLEIVFYLTLAVGVLSFVGLWTNLSLSFFTIGNLFMQAYIYSYHDIHHPHGIMMIALSVLALAPCGTLLSADTWFRQSGVSQESNFAKWPLLLIQWIFALAYFSAAEWKMTTSGLDWVNGYTLQYYLASDAMRNDMSLGLWLSQHHVLSQLFSWATIIFEGTFSLVLIFPVLAFIYIPAGIAIHTGMYLTMKANFFQWVAVYSVFVPWSKLLKNLLGNQFFKERVKNKETNLASPISSDARLGVET